MSTTDQTSETCNSLLRGEISAIETYGQAIEKYSDATDTISLRNIRADHVKAAGALRTLILECGDQPDTTSGLWGGFAKTIEGAAALLGESPALRILQQGEQHGINQCEEALANLHVTESAKNVIRGQILPMLQEHILALQLRAKTA